MQLAPVDRYSAEVTLCLLIDGHELQISQVGPDMLILRDQLDTKTTNATLVITVDGNERRQEIVLPQGLSVGREEYSYF
jgi:hypothetical protein